MSKRYEVRSDRDGEIAFDAVSVAREASRWRTTPLQAARRIARENGDAGIGETLTVHEAEDEALSECPKCGDESLPKRATGERNGLCDDCLGALLDVSE